MAAKSAAERSMQKAVTEVKAFNSREEQDEHITAVTFDGTWMKRGFTSFHGVFTCIDWNVGLVLDLHVSTKCCQSCRQWKERREHGKISVEAFHTWQVSHTPHCPINTDRSAPGMESEADALLWQRSMAKNGLQYRTFIGDGDSKGFSSVNSAQPYGPDVPVVKEECVGHVQKRMGSHLRNLKHSMRGQRLDDGKHIGGQGRLTDNVIDILQTYYGNAIRSHPNDIHGMGKEVWAALFHRASSDDKPQHMFCPEGVNSWCGWQLVKAGKKDAYQHHDILPPAVVAAIKPTYNHLTTRSLLLRCLRGATQNQNESFNGMIWSLCPKTSFCGAAVIEISSFLAVCQFNEGSVSLLEVLKSMGCTEGRLTQQFLAYQDAERVAGAERKIKKAEKHRRKQRRRRRKSKTWRMKAVRTRQVASR